MKQSVGQVWFYTHSNGSNVKEATQAALKRKQRWDDESYLARIIADSIMDKDDHGGETGFGISCQMQDNSHDIVVVDVPSKAVFLIPESAINKDGQVPVDYVPDKGKCWSFDKFIKLKLPSGDE